MSSSAKLNNWLPLESNSDVINEYIKSLGATDMLRYFDVVSFDEEALEFVPQPIFAALFTFPWVKAIRDHNLALVQKQMQEDVKKPEDLYFMRQTAKNACGTVAILHALLNIFKEQEFLFQEESFVEKFLKDTHNQDSDERAQHLMECKTLNQMHVAAVHQGASVVNADRVEHHFIAFVWKDGGVWELDGAKQRPLFHGEIPQDLFMERVFDVCKDNYLALAPEEVGFNLMALSCDFQ